MKITDALGRDLDITVVVKGPRGWMTPLGYKIDNVPTEFVRVPHGPFALRVMVKDGADLMVHLDGELLLATSVPGGIHYLEHAGDGKPFVFDEPSAQSEDVCDVMPHRNLSAGASTGKLKAPRGHGLLFVVARFASEMAPGPQPPRQEYSFPLQMNDGPKHDALAAANLRRMVCPANPPNIDDITSREPGREPISRHCTVCGHDH